MNAGIVTSFVVGGMILLSILRMNFTVNANATQTTVQLFSKSKIDAVAQTLSFDMDRMGYGVNKADQVIIGASGSNKIVFKADENNTGTPQTISWELTSSAYTASENPDDYELIRTGPDGSGGTMTTTYAATYFDITYYKEDGTTTTDMSKVREIEIKLITESPVKYQTDLSNPAAYARSFWQKRFVPPGIQKVLRN